ncbi:MAG: DUF2309 domain-containing protein [Pirellulaceae bacterium]|nr:DUF2309 domain-containing protein [Pirellulaceae bacterium]
MHALAVGDRQPNESATYSPLAHLREAIERAARLLPSQGPITVFISQNTLQAFEHLPFEEAVKRGAQVFGHHSYLSEDRFRHELARGRIRHADLLEALAEDLGTGAYDAVPGVGTRLDLRMAMLQYPLRTGPAEELLWFVAETDALRKVRWEASAADRSRLIAETRHWVLRDLRGGNESSLAGAAAREIGGAPAGLLGLLDRFDESEMESWSEAQWEGLTLQMLWRVCCDGVRGIPAPDSPRAFHLRHRDLLLKATGNDTDQLVHDLLIKFCAAFLDQGLASWPLPGRDRGFFAAFRAVYRQAGGPPDGWLWGLRKELARLDAAETSPVESVRESLELLGVSPFHWEPFIADTLVALRGWGGMVRQVEVRGDRVPRPIAEGSLVEFLAVRLILDRLAVAHVASQSLGYRGTLADLRETLRDHAQFDAPGDEQRAFQMFQLAQVMRLTPSELHRLTTAQWTSLVSEIEAFAGIERQRLFHLAYERRFRTQALDAIALHARQATGRPPAPRFQVVCCLDEREESLRRHLEEVAPDVETFGTAGFFGVAMYYRGAADAHFVPLCPIVIRPQHWVTEDVAGSAETTHRRRARTRRVLGTASHRFHLGSRGFAWGALLTGAVGVLASIPLVARILFPRLSARIARRFEGLVQAPEQTALHLGRRDEQPGPENGGLGFSPDEMTSAAERLLRDIGLTSGLSRLVLLIGHGSNSQNNPHNSAYMCGACGGAAGGPNARAVAQMLNDPEVRAQLAARGIAIPAETWFVGGYHDTCSDSITFADWERIPPSHRDEFSTAQRDLDAACDRNAHERCRRFMSAPLKLSFAAARKHVEERADDLAQTRPELGHASNAICLVGRRELSRGLFLDRRAFLTSYDPSQDDDESSILARTLQAVFPVCGGINLQYYFSSVDNQGFGAGTKLPHNIAALVGVMDGAASDLRTGLPWQGVEIHEPMRLLFIIETTAERMLRIMDNHAGIGQMCRNGWVQLALVHPASRAVSVFQRGQFEPYQPRDAALPRAASSVDWYRGWRDHLEFAQLGR